MSVSLGVYVIRPADDTYRKKLAAWLALKDAGIDAPKALQEYFGWEEPDEKGLVQYLHHDHPALEAYADDCAEGYTVDLSKLGPDVRYLRVTLG